MRFERRREPLAPRRRFVSRLARAGAIAAAMVAIMLAAGMAGYMGFEHMGAVDAFVNAAMILSGMGPMGELKTDGGKIFAGCYALASGLVVVIAMGFVLAPIGHRFLHAFHVENRRDED
jgi:hypothetical protein